MKTAFPIGENISVFTNQVTHLLSVSSYPEGKIPMLRANMELITGLVGLFGEAETGGDPHEHSDDGMEIDAGENEWCCD